MVEETQPESGNERPRGYYFRDVPAHAAVIRQGQRVTVDDQVLDDKTYALRRITGAAANLVTGSAFWVRVAAVPTASFIGGAYALNGHLNVAGTVAFYAMAAVALCANLDLAARDARVIEQKYFTMPRRQWPDLETRIQAEDTRDDGLLYKELRTSYASELDNVWYRSVAIGQSALSPRRQYLKAFTTGLKIGFKHNTLTELLGCNKRDDVIEFRLSDGACRMDMRQGAGYERYSTRPENYFEAGWRSPLI